MNTPELSEREVSVNMPRDDRFPALRAEIQKKYRDLLQTALKLAQQKETEAAKLLGISTRTLKKKREVLNI